MSLKNNAKKKQVRQNERKTEALTEVTKEPTKRLNVNVPESILKAFKIKAIQNDKDMATLVNHWIASYLKK